jgi:hypothetical protein
MKKVKIAIFWFSPQISVIETKRNLDKNAENFYNASIFFQIFTISNIFWLNIMVATGIS